MVSNKGEVPGSGGDSPSLEEWKREIAENPERFVPNDLDIAIGRIPMDKMDAALDALDQSKSIEDKGERKRFFEAWIREWATEPEK